MRRDCGWYLHFFILLLHFTRRLHAISEGDVLRIFIESVVDPTRVLDSWELDVDSPCTWPHVTCNDQNKVTRLDLGNSQLSGKLVSNLSSLTALQHFRLNNNLLTGPIPNVLTNINKLQVLDLSNNDLSGTVPITGSFFYFTPISFQGNPKLCGPGVLKQCKGDPPPPPEPLSKSTYIPPPNQSPTAEDSEVHLGQLRQFSLREILVATDGFNSKNILGRGGFGIVYRGRLADATLVAVKRLKQERRSGGELQFHTEVEMISLAVHRNLLHLRGFCINHKERLLVYSYMSNGSVESWLRERSEVKPPLDWPTRKKIALGSARGLSYLHDYCDPKIIHRDIKAANILLDDEFEAVVGDFGLVKLMNYKDTHVTTAAKGTIGHIAPEYLSTGKASEKTDVFSYGILLLELITGKKALDIARISNDDGFLLLDWVTKFIQDQRVNMLVDSELQSNYDVDDVKKLLKISQLLHKPRQQKGLECQRWFE